MREKRACIWQLRKEVSVFVGVNFTVAASVMLAAVLLAGATSTVAFEDGQSARLHNSHSYEYQCFDDNVIVSSSLNLDESIIGLQVSDHTTHQLMTRIFAIFLRDILHYRNISLIPIKFNGDMISPKYEQQKLHYTLEQIRNHPDLPDMSMINLEVWMPALGHSYIPTTINDAGPSMTPGRFGWFVPKSRNTSTSTSFNSLQHNIFLDPSNPFYEQYLISEDVLNYLRKSTELEEFIGPKCVQHKCVTLLAEHRYDSAFVENQIIQTESYLNVLWMGTHFKQKMKWLHKLYQRNTTLSYKRYIVLHWIPSEVIDPDVMFDQIAMPRCEEFSSLINSYCKYELTPVLKYYHQIITSNPGSSRLLNALHQFTINDSALLELKSDFNDRSSQVNKESSEHIFNVVACNWLKRNTATYNNWISREPAVTLLIGGILPITETGRGHQNLVDVVRRAVVAVNQNNTVLTNYNLKVIENDGQCKADVVMKDFIHYFNVQNVLGVLGPECSETVEPIAGISKHTNMAVISYSAEGASFVDRQAYPYFFRTIGSNWQYVDVYINLMQHMGWHRIAALTEDGQRYTEYISHMETAMKKHNLELIINKKFLSDVTAAEMNKCLVDLKHRHAKIIIADIHDKHAELALCEAYKLDMTAYKGYVWFLPSWLSKKWSSLTQNIGNNYTCSSEQMRRAFEGHFSIMHTPFGEPSAKMQENIPIKEWLQSFDAGNESISKYTGFAYDAVWAYALAADQLLHENKEAVKNLRSNIVVNRFVELIWKTDFEGLSGRVRFGQGGSRITELNIMQWRMSQSYEIGKFYPEVIGKRSNLRTDGGRLDLREDMIEWLSEVKPPGDGTYDCSFSALAEMMGTTCDSAAMIFTTLVCLMAVVIVSLVSFLFWKQRYDQKLKQSEKIMKKFGIYPSSPSRNKPNTLDKWEIPKENVVINRRLGEGAFGTVYGGEAQLIQDGWTAVAVKTLKAGASIEDRVDFLSEAEAMKRFDHKNIVKLLGVCLQSEPIYTIMEFMLYGDLKTYLLARRHMVNDKTSDDSDISPKRLTVYAMDVTRGLAYLAQQKYVHRDIACRNCLVNAQRVVKLGDFGMARPTFENDYYRFNRKGMLPVRWMAPESLALGMFTPASDVWAFGVVLYEIITFGSFPYQGLTNNQVLEFVKEGNTLQIPIGIKPHLEGLLKACWSRDVKKRPTATEIVEYISSYPRLLTPCLDFPSASVEMPETESDELELLPKPSSCSSALNNFDNQTNFNEDMGMPEQTHIDLPTGNGDIPLGYLDTFSSNTPDSYIVMSPLLIHQVSVSSDSSESRLLNKSPAGALQ